MSYNMRKGLVNHLKHESKKDKYLSAVTSFLQKSSI